MNNGNSLLKVFSTVSLILTLGVSMNADAGLFGFGGDSWKEEVLLHDGSKIIVERSLERGGRHEIGQRSGATNETLSFAMPGTNQTVSWEDQFSEDIGSSNFNLLMLDIFKGATYLVASPMGCLSYNKWGRPNPPYVIFKNMGKDWKRISIQELPSELKTPNLVISSPDDAKQKAKHGVVSAEAIKELNSSAQQPEFKTILREAVKGGGITNCEHMIPYGKGGWLGLDWFRDQPNYEACLMFCKKKAVSQQNCPCETLFKGAK